MAGMSSRSRNQSWRQSQSCGFFRRAVELLFQTSPLWLKPGGTFCEVNINHFKKGLKMMVIHQFLLVFKHFLGLKLNGNPPVFVGHVEKGDIYSSQW